MLFGHIAASALLHRYLNADLKPAVLGGIFPDVVDKTLCRVLHLTPSGRMFAHTLLSWGLSTVVVGLLRGPRTAWSWGLGYLGHLVGDSDGSVPWFYPFSSYQFEKRERFNLFETLSEFFVEPNWLEWVLLLWAILVFARGRRRIN